MHMESKEERKLRLERLKRLKPLRIPLPKQRGATFQDRTKYNRKRSERGQNGLSSYFGHLVTFLSSVNLGKF